MLPRSNLPPKLPLHTLTGENTLHNFVQQPLPLLSRFTYYDLGCGWSLLFCDTARESRSSLWYFFFLFSFYRKRRRLVSQTIPATLSPDKGEKERYLAHNQQPCLQVSFYNFSYKKEIGFMTLCLVQKSENCAAAALRCQKLNISFDENYNISGGLSFSVGFCRIIKVLSKKTLVGDDGGTWH